jgi:hypothetical protein
MAHILGIFDGLELRAVGEEDRERLEKWIAADEHHAGIRDADFFMGLRKSFSGETEADPRATCTALEDEKGTVFFIRLSRATRVNIQFGPGKTVHQRKRVVEALVKGMAFLEVALERAGAEEWIFETEDAGLAEMAGKHLGFRESPNELVRLIEPLEPPERAPQAVRGEQQITQGVQ